MMSQDGWTWSTTGSEARYTYDEVWELFQHIRCPKSQFMMHRIDQLPPDDCPFLLEHYLEAAPRHYHLKHMLVEDVEQKDL